MKNVAFIRGGLGLQTLEYMAVNYLAHRSNKKIDQIYLSVGRNENALHEQLSINWLKKLFIVDFAILFVDSLAKQAIWKNPDLFKAMVSSIDEIRPNLKNKVHAHDRPLLHVRSGDRSVSTIQRFVSLGEKFGRDLVIVGNDKKTNTEIIKQLGFGEDISADAVSDWRAIVGAPTLGAAFSSFSVSAMLFDIKKEYLFIEPRGEENKEVTHNEKQIMNFLINNIFINGKTI